MKKFQLLLFILIPAVLFSQNDKELAETNNVIRKAFNEKNAYATVAFVEQRWRLAGNKGFDESIFYVENILKKAGYVNESVATTKNRFTYRIERRPLKRPSWEPVDAIVEIIGDPVPLLSFKTNRNMLAINSGNTPPEGIEADLVYAEKTTKEALESLDLKGKLLFADQGVGQVHRIAVQKGAIGALGYSLPGYLKPTKHTNSIQFTGISYSDSLSKTFGILLSPAAKDRLKAALLKGPVRLRIKTVATFRTSDELTIIADIKGNSQPDERFVFSAHVQEPGANDNATGVGTLAEMARTAAELISKGKLNPKRSISFLWGDEIVSTRRYVTEDKERAKGILWGMSLDMVGEDVKKTGGSFLIEKMPDPSAVWTRGEEKHTEWGGGVLKENAIVPHYFNDFILNRCLDQAKTNGWIVKTNPFEGGSDHTPFLQANIPGLLMWHFTDEFYHTDGDRLENVSAWEMKNVGVSALVAAITLTSSSEKTALFLVEELKVSAFKRLEVEMKLSQDAIKNGGSKEKESHILETWSNYYVGALAKMNNLIPGGITPKLEAAIQAAQKQVSEKSEQLIKAL